MAERKVLNKYYPPDFDPAKIPRLRQDKNRQYKVRLMAPFSMRCSTCGQWIGKGTKFNARKETVEGEMFYSMRIFRFYIRCTRCNAEITFKTDPANLGYVCEHGAQRNFEPWRDESEQAEQAKRKREEEEENNPMRALENRTEESRREMEILDALDEIQTRNALQERANVDTVIEQVASRRQQEAAAAARREAEEDERLAREAFEALNGEKVRRASDEDADKEEAEVRRRKLFSGAFGSNKKSASSVGSAIPSEKAFGIIVKKRKPEERPAAKGSVEATAKVEPQGVKVEAVEESRPAGGIASLVGDYGSDSDTGSD
ncbi:Pre-mRNA-splicing factor cwf16 [Spiromyces aspiralis]|uniref:Pre-mRNA-splicing factor cwf16 n=1 Tax=Spiromyces aspiralis TaxID=68401 RepID=A0ACC1HNP7_9FUNG|nr:Pre-mRNA-splicing factor cwf16 [Spiromyces aspiralis]